MGDISRGRRFGIIDILEEFPQGTDSEKEVTLKLSDLYDLVETIRTTTLEMKNTKAGTVDEDNAEQGIRRLENLYKELTGLELDKGYWNRN